MIRRAIPKTILLITLSMVCMVFFYQCHTAPSSGKNEHKVERNQQPVRLADIREGALVREVADTGLYEVLPQLKTSVQTNIEGMVASTTVDQIFTNASADPIEAVYVFPLPQNAAVHDMKILINDRLIQGVVKEKEEARKVYEEAREEGKTAGLSEQERPNIFTNSVANIMPGDTIIVRLQYVEKLLYEDGSFRLRFPMVVAPRYIPGSEIIGRSGSGMAHDTDAVSDASRITPPVAGPATRSGSMVSLTVNVNAGLPVSSVSSVSHDLDIFQVGDSAFRVELKNRQVIPNKDFVLEYSIKSGSEPQAALFAASLDDDDYFMLMAVPPAGAEQEKSIKKDVIFVLDVSGSMDGTSIEQARAGLVNALDLLYPEDHFNIIAFNSSYESFATGPVEASTRNIMNGTNYVNNLVADGGTEALPALQEAMHMKGRQEALQMIIFLTDGSVGNEDQLMALVNRDIGRSRLFTIGIGSAPNSFLMEKAAQLGKGTFTFISNIEEVEDRIDDLFTKIENPVLMDLKLDIPEGAEIFPSPIPDLFAGQPLVVLGKAEQLSSTMARLSGRTPDGDFAIDIPIDINAATYEPAIPALWARSSIANLMDRYRQGNEDAKQNIIDLAVKHRLITQFTSFVAVEHRIVNPRGESRLSIMPTELPEGWTYEEVSGGEGPVRLASLPQTASGAPLIALMGFILISTGAVILFTGMRPASEKQRLRKIA